MHNLDITYVEKVGDKFHLPDYFKAREITIEILHESAKLIEVGMNEFEGREIVEKVMHDYGVKRKWHPIKFRIGRDTVKSFREASEYGTKVCANDIYFIDIGPVINNYEGDFGRTFVVGNTHESERYRHIKLAVEDVFTKVRQYFLNTGANGEKLYEYAQSYTESLGYRLNPKTAGHRLGDFPHALYYKGKLREINHAQIAHPQLWVLEIQIEDISGDFGAFYEDVLSSQK